MERTLFLGAAQEALDSGVDIEVYSTDSYPSAFEECEPVAEQIAMSGADVLPIMLVNGEVKVSFMYPTAEQITRFSKAHKVKKPKVNAAAAACGPSGSSGFTPIPDLAPGALHEPAGFAATLAGKKPQVVGGPDIGNRVNLMGGDTGDGIPSEVQSPPNPADADAVAADAAAKARIPARVVPAPNVYMRVPRIP